MKLKRKTSFKIINGVGYKLIIRQLHNLLIQDGLFTLSRQSVCVSQSQRRIVQNYYSLRFKGCTFQIWSYLKLDFLHDANTSMGHGSKVTHRRLYATSEVTWSTSISKGDITAICALKEIHSFAKKGIKEWNALVRTSNIALVPPPSYLSLPIPTCLQHQVQSKSNGHN